MVEPQRSLTRSVTPTAASFRLVQADGPKFHFDSDCGERAFLIFYDIENSGLSGLSGHTGDDITFHSSMPGDAASRTTPVREWSRPDPRRRQSHPASAARPPGFRPPTNPSAQGYFQAQTLAHGPEGQHPTGSPFTHYPPTSYPQRSGYYGQYTVPNQPSLGVAQGSPYAYPHAYHSPGGVESSLGRHEMQSNFQPMVTPHHPPYPYPQQTHSQDDISSTSPMLSPASSSRYNSHPQATHSPPPQPYIGSGHFAGMAYPSPMGNAQYTYTSHFSANPPMYRPYGPMAYPQHAASAPPEEAQGTWYFLSHGSPAPPQQYHYDGGQYQHPYTTLYPPHTDHPSFPASSVTDSRNSPFHSSTPVTGHAVSQSTPPTSELLSAPPHSETGASSPSYVSRPTSGSSKPISRREWHPKPPPHRSPWVMWVGNVPSDATQDELWEFFSSVPGGEDTSDGTSSLGSAVVSIFLIGRSNCAFINYSSEASLEAAIKTFHGKRLRPNDPQCPMLVCKVRRSADDLKSGVGGQRGTGMHKQWVKEQRKLQRSHSGSVADVSASDDASVSSQDVLDLVDDVNAVSLDPHQPRTRRPKPSDSSESYASTSSSLLGEHFPTRYFILKSLSERDLEISVQNGLWATQKHNELVLDRAFRTSKDVFLIFSVNKSGEFYGYARMAGPIRQGEGRVSWSSRSPTSPPSTSPSVHLTSVAERRLIPDGPVYMSPETFQRPDDPPAIATGCPPTITHSQERESRRALLQRQQLEHHAESAPAKLGGPEESTQRSPSLKFSLDQHQRRQQTLAAQVGFHLDPEAPFRAMKDPSAADGISDGDESPQPVKAQSDMPAHRGEGAVDGDKPSPSWGDCFKVEWLELRKVPFHKTRHLRNAWNKGREIKVSRDGTELESSVGKRFLEEWASLAES